MKAPGPLVLRLLPRAFAMARLAPGAPLPDWASGGELVAAIRDPDELTILCAAEAVPPGVAAETGWRALKVRGPLDFGLVGVLASLAGPLAAAGVPLCALATFSTDYILVKDEHLATAHRALAAAGHQVEIPGQGRVNPRE